MGLAKASLEANVRYMANRWVRKVCVLTPSLLVRSVLCGLRYQRLPQNAGSLRSRYPVRRTVTIEDVGNSAAFLCSDSLPVSPVKWSTLTAVSASLHERTRIEIIILLVNIGRRSAAVISVIPF